MHDKLFKYSFSLLNVDYVKLNQRWSYTNVISPYYRLYYIEEGAGIISDQLEIFNLKPGYLYLIPSYTICNLECKDHISQYFIHFFEESPDAISLFHNNRMIRELKASEVDIGLFKRMISINPGRGINRSDNPKIYEKETYYKEYRKLNNKMNIAVQFESQGIILLLISRFVNSIHFVLKKPEIIPSKVLDSMNYIRLNLDKTLTVKKLAENAYQNQDYFSKQFLLHTGQRPLSYIHEKKIERAQYLIVTTNKTLLDIAMETGFSSLPHFFKIFKKKVNLTPGEYRYQTAQIG